jgi:HK97 family phage prohead protease
VRDQFGEFAETIRSGAFNKSITTPSKKAADDVFLYVNHRHADVPMASRNAKTLKLDADPNLRAWATLDPARSDVVIARSAVMRGEMSQMSIGFTVNKSRDQWNDNYTERTIHEVNLKEVSIVPIGANPHTSASMRSFDEFMDTLKTMDDLTEADIERAIAYFNELRTIPEINPFAERDRLEREALERKLTARPGLDLF